MSGGVWSIKASHSALGEYRLYGKESAELLFIENESSSQRLWGLPNATPFVKDSFHRRVIDRDIAAVNPVGKGTKGAAWYNLSVPAGGIEVLELLLSAEIENTPFDDIDTCFVQRLSEADAFYEDILPDADDHDRHLFRQAMAGMIWSKQFFHYEVLKWLQGDDLPAPASRQFGQNRRWKHLRAGDVLSMPDT